VLLVMGVVGALVVGVEFFSRIVRAAELPPQAMTGAWFIPIVVLVLTPSATVRLVALDPAWATTTAVALSAALWGAGMLMFLLLAPILGWRLITAPGPVAAQAASWWIWLAPAGAGGLGALAVARLAAHVLGGPSALVLPTAGLLVATAMWGFGTWWAMFAGRVLWSVSRSEGGLPFHLGSWGFVFPTAAMAALTVELARTWDSAPMAVAGAVGWAVALMIWARLGWQTVVGVRDGSIFVR